MVANHCMRYYTYQKKKREREPPFRPHRAHSFTEPYSLQCAVVFFPQQMTLIDLHNQPGRLLFLTHFIDEAQRLYLVANVTQQENSRAGMGTRFSDSGLLLPYHWATYRGLGLGKRSRAHHSCITTRVKNWKNRGVLDGPTGHNKCPQLMSSSVPKTTPTLINCLFI